MTTDNTPATPLALLGLGDMGTALAHTWLAAGHSLTVWNRTAAKAEPLAAEGARVAASAADAVSAADLVVVCLLDDASVGEALAAAELTGKDIVNLTTGTPAQARERASWARQRGARFLDGGIMAVPPMIGTPQAGGYIFYSGDHALFEQHRDTLAVPAATRYVGSDPGHAALHDVALLSAMTGMFAGITHAFALMRPEQEVKPTAFAPLLTEWLRAMLGMAESMAQQLESGDYTEGVTSNLAMMAAGNATLEATAEEQGVSRELLGPFMASMRERDARGYGDEGLAGLVDMLRQR
ncbi:NAD(P)-binding domain-containing protein [Streptomyces sp. 891-h]|uniref:NAD(P)-dependent oxidoreductase n=1 Tax=Streptomyces sp. 891-h TaxID=2720714 RepID=UPI001FAA99D0|nr:NAD(P)-binding domain-containing protein [Streptomyces sp. 891-h]UNZ16796.1 NAD(P)-dependent oxidoreductase [Streptomyces sp. 891-h]